MSKKERENKWDFLQERQQLLREEDVQVLSDGSCGSIGYGIATAYAKEGANLVLTGRNVKKLEERERRVGTSLWSESSCSTGRCQCGSR